MIQILSKETISQISAGEVVESPSHLIKELIENSIDAEATEIEVNFDQGGRFVKVKDNGCGISKKEMPLALDRYATSKIKKTEDLWKVNSFGFRGEALASISSVSDLTLISGLKTGDSSYQLRSRFGNRDLLENSHESQGTVVIVRSLFENTPARFKFLKSEGSENSAIKNTLKALALSNPKICFRILQKGKLLFHWPGRDHLKDRSAQVLNCKELYFTEAQRGDYFLSAVLSPPHITLKNRKSSWFFVQNRWVESRVIHAGLMSAYRGLLMHGEYPLAVVKIKGPPDEIDVNVHPTKSQIRFKNSSFIFKCVESPIRQLLEQAPWTKKITSPSQSPQEKNLEMNPKFFKQTNWKQNHEPYPNKEVLSQMKWEPKDLSSQEMPNAFSSQEDKTTQGIKDSNDSQEAPIAFFYQRALNSNLKPRSYKMKELKVKTDSQLHKSSWSDLQILAQAHLTYIVCQSSHSLVFIDQHASHERILYERIMNSWSLEDIEKQKLLIPIVLELEEGQSQALLGLKKELEKLGVEIESLGPESVLVASAPSVLKEKALQEGLLFLAKQRVETGDHFAFERVISDLSATMACHSAIRAGKSLKWDQMTALLKQMDEFPLSSFCPHGRPVFVEYPISKLEKDFGRVT